MQGKGVKRKRSSDGEADAPPGGSLVGLSVSKLHRSLRRVEPDLRHLVLVANTLRRAQEETVLRPGDADDPPADDDAPASGAPDSAGACCPPLPAGDPGGGLLSAAELALFSSLLEDLGGSVDAECWGAALGEAPPEGGGPAPERTLLSAGSYWLDDEPGGDFEDIDTSMYDGAPRDPAGLKGGEGQGQGERPSLADLDFLMDALAEAQEERRGEGLSGPG